MEHPHDSKKVIACDFLHLVSVGDVEEAYAAYVSADFRHHNAYFPGDAQALKKGMKENYALFPSKTVKVEHALGDGDLVAVHSRVRLKEDMPEMALVHIFRFEGDRIVELWDVGQQVPTASPNQNGMF